MYRQGQLVHAVAARHHTVQAVPHDVRARRRRDRHMLVARPYVRLVGARLGEGFRVECRVHRQRQLEHAVAVVRRLQAVPDDVRSGSRRDRHVGMARPYVRLIVARHGGCLGVIGRVHRQRQLIHAVAVVHRLQAVPQDVCACRRRNRHVGVAFPYVRNIVACRGGGLLVESRIHNQRQLIHAVAAVHRLLSVVILAGGRAVLAVPIVRQFILAQHHRLFIRIRRVHNHSHTVHIVAARFHIVHRICINTGRRDGLSTPCRTLALTEIDIIAHIFVRRVHLKIQHIHAVATGQGLQTVVIDTA